MSNEMCYGENQVNYVFARGSNKNLICLKNIYIYIIQFDNV